MEKNQIAVQDYALVNSKYKLSSSEIKFVMLSISKIDSVKDLNFRDEYIIPISEISTAFQTEQNYKQLRAFAKSLMSKPVTIETADGWEIYNFFSRVKYVEGEGAFRVQMHKDLKPYLLELKKNFVQTDLKYIMHMTSQYAVRLYQLLKQYQKLGGREFMLAELQDTLQIPKSMYIFNNFKTKVLNIAIEQINEYTDLTVAYKVKKIGRKINELDFSIKTKEKSEIQTSQLFEVEATELPEQVKLIKGTYGFLNRDNFYTPFADGSFNLEKNDGSKMFFKSLKQLDFFAKNPDKF